MDRSESYYADPVGGFEAEEQPLVGADDRSLMIIKGKRTKRPRTPSTCGGGGTAAVSSSSTSGGGDYEFSLSSSSGATVLGSTEEEEDMAYCLILLAQGPRRQTDQGGGAKMDGGEHFRSNKKFSEVAAGGGTSTKASFYVYECKTCNRTFPSFQALGGHRAGHKKPRAAAEDTKRSSPELNSDEDEEEGKFHKITTMSPPLSSIPNFPRKLLQGTKPKIHECSVCGLEYSSGQALGGHMRRHRAALAPSSTMNYHVAMSIDSMVTSHHHDSCVVGENASRGVLSLDLNLPAPEDDSKFQFTAASTTQKSLLFSAPALVDCHY